MLEMNLWLENLSSSVRALPAEALYAGMIFAEEMISLRLEGLGDLVTVSMSEDELLIEAEEWLLKKYEGDIEFVVAATTQYMSEFIDSTLEQEI